jgi:hypothetical protein
VLQGIGNTVEGLLGSPLLLSAYPSDSDEDEDPTSISAVLSSLHARYPALNYLQYEATLRQHGICYAINVSSLDSDFFINRVGMAEGAIGIFMDQARKQIKMEAQRKARRRIKGKKRARIESDMENVDPHLSSTH